MRYKRAVTGAATHRDDPLAHLNDPQREAVLHDRGPLVVFAGAGSGKTRVITHRIARLVAEIGVPAYRILAVTFTNKAAGEMRERLEKLVPGASRDLVVGTFHATCARLLRRNADLAGVNKDFTVYDDSDQKQMITRVLRDMKYDEKRFPPRMIASLINSAKNEMRGPEEAELAGFDAERIREVYREYEKRMTAANALDFGDLIYRMVRALEGNVALHEKLAMRFSHLLVDEFQDTNHAQFRLVRALGSAHRNVCVVGDDDQSIYRWRGADRRNILDFRRHYPDAHVVKLEQNYRSTKRILRAAHAVIEKNVDREPKQLWTDNGDGTPIGVVRCTSEREEADLVVEAARELRRNDTPLTELAVFYRIHAQSRVVEEALRAANIPYRIVGGLRFYDRAEVKDLLAYLRVLATPEDDVSLLRILNVPARGIGKTTIERVLDLAAGQGISAWAALGRAAEEKASGALARFVALIEGLRAERETLSLSELAERILEVTGYEAALRKEDTPEADSRLENLAELVGSMRQFEEEASGKEGDASLTEFLERVTLDNEAVAEEGPKDAVTLMTVHAAKGLEFRVVLVLGMEEQLFPLRAQDESGSEEELEEERRLAYVAMTRAREKLVLSYATSRYVFGQPRMNPRSRFLDDLPAADVSVIGESRGRAPAPRASWQPPIGARSETYTPPSARSESFGGSLRGARGGAGAGETVLHRDDDDGGGSGLRRGMAVRHVRYGVGRVAAIEGGTPPKVVVEFPEHGKKQIVSTYLTPV
jgi:DNA helicase-2/ATP-dependent DNA helicase PcrA